MSIAITGVTGFIGRELTRLCQSRGIKVFRLVRNPGDDSLLWHLGQPLPSQCADVSAVVHLACATLSAPQSVDAAAKRDINGSRVLIDSVRELRKARHRIRFIFVSTQSARAEAGNLYGQSKWTIESMLNQDDEIIIRPGLVYGEEIGSVYSLFDTLVRLPVVPAVSGRASIQPIHVQELAECIVQIAAMERPAHLYKLGASKALTFAQVVRATARRRKRIPPIVIPIPASPIRAAARLLDRKFGLTSLTERIEGLLALQPMDTEASLAALGRSLQPLDGIDH